jgi:hypothetical protein
MFSGAQLEFSNPGTVPSAGTVDVTIAIIIEVTVAGPA